MFTVEHIRRIAATLRDSKPESEHLGKNTHIHWNVVCENFAHVLARENCQFDRTKFLRRCGYLGGDFG